VGGIGRGIVNYSKHHKQYYW